MAFPGFLLYLWGVVQATLQSLLGRAVTDFLTSLWDRVVAAVRDRTVFWGHQVEVVNTSTAHLVGREEINGYLKKIAGYLQDDDVRIIGICGMGGVGKTTLLELVNNDFPKIGVPGFDVVIYVTVSQDANILKIQKQIVKRLTASLSADATGSSSEADEQADYIFKALSKRRFLLLLDDVWEKLDLVKVGIPDPSAENKSKIILTTRSEQVCIDMGDGDHLVKVNELNAFESWELFKKNVGTRVDLDDTQINPLAQAVAKKCGRLPLALMIVGRAMATATTAGEWEEALEQLREAPHMLPGMVDEVLSLLKFSFDRLPDETTRQCLLYCCLFPEDEEIAVEKIIEYWVGEGLLDYTHSDSVVRAQKRGHGVITKLKSACLLESGAEHLTGSCVKMHDVVREMCLWLTEGESDKGNTFLVYAGKDSVPRSARWGEAKRISLMRNSSDEDLPHNMPSFPNLRTLLCGEFAGLPCSIPRRFFKCMPALCVLDLSNCSLKSLPKEISVLAKLRYLNLQDNSLQSLPEEISSLTELRYLNLRGTCIESLPRGLGKLAKLSQLNLDDTKYLSRIPGEAIPILTGLQVLGMCWSLYDFGLLNGSLDTRRSWKRLEELWLTVRTLSSLEMFSKYDRLRSCITRLQISLGWDAGITAARVSVALERLEKMRVLYVYGCEGESEDQLGIGNRCGSNLLELELKYLAKITVVVSSPCSFMQLRLLTIVRCHGIRHLMWIRQLRRLQEIRLDLCEGMEELLPGVDGGLEQRGVDNEALPALRRISLWCLPALKSISTRPLLFPCLECLVVRGCPQLKKLPLGPDSAKNIREIWGERDWWESLEWHQDADESRFLPCFQAC